MLKFCAFDWELAPVSYVSETSSAAVFFSSMWIRLSDPDKLQAIGQHIFSTLQNFVRNELVMQFGVTTDGGRERENKQRHDDFFQ